MDVTVLELHLPEAQFETPFSGRSRGDRKSPEAETADESGGRSSGLVALAVFVGLVALAWYLRNGRGGMGTETDDALAERPA